jgi:cytochrome c biogenesis factor
MAEIGHITLIIALSAAVFTAVASVAGARLGSEKLLKSSRIG